MDLAALAGLLAALFVKEAGVPLPVPGDLLVLGAGVATASQGPAAATAVFAAILAAGYAGGSVQFGLVRGAMRRPLLALLQRVGVSAARLDRLAGWLRQRGWRGVASARMTPGVRVGAIAASGLAALPFPVFGRGLVAGNAVFAGGHFLLGYLVGVPAERLLSDSSGPLLVLAGGVALAALGAVAWWARGKRGSRAATGPQPEVVTRTSRTPGVPTETQAEGGYAAWIEAACPACLVIGLARPLA